MTYTNVYATFCKIFSFSNLFAYLYAILAERIDLGCAGRCGLSVVILLPEIHAQLPQSESGERIHVASLGEVEVHIDDRLPQARTVFEDDLSPVPRILFVP